MSNEDPLKYYFVQNFGSTNKILGFRKRNFWEGVIAAAILGWGIHFIPFVLRVQIIVTLALCISTFAGFAIGIHGRSVTEFIFLFLRYRIFKKEYHLRSVKYGKYKSPEKYDENGSRLSYAEQGLAFIRKFGEEKTKNIKNSKGDKPKVKRVTTSHRKK